MLRKAPVQAVILVIAGLVIAVVANGFASRERRLVLPGYYPNALRVPPRPPERPKEPVAAAMTSATETIAQSPAPGQPPIAIPTDTIERPAGIPVQQPVVASPAADPRQAVSATPAAPVAAKPPAADPLARFVPHPDKPAVEISGADAAMLHARGVLFLDARRTAAFEEGHVAGARPFSVWESDIDEKVNTLFEERSSPEQQNQPIVIYCTGGQCEDSHMLAEKLWGIQFNNVYVYKDGYPDWQKRGGAVKNGAQP